MAEKTKFAAFCPQGHAAQQVELRLKDHRERSFTAVDSCTKIGASHEAFEAEITVTCAECSAGFGFDGFWRMKWPSEGRMAAIFCVSPAKPVEKKPSVDELESATQETATEVEEFKALEQKALDVKRELDARRLKLLAKGMASLHE